MNANGRVLLAILSLFTAAVIYHGYKASKRNMHRNDEPRPFAAFTDQARSDPAVPALEPQRSTGGETLAQSREIGGLSLQASRTITEAYQYPVLPGTDEWKRRVWTELPWNLCEIPEDVLTNLTDLALLNTVLRYPMRGDIHAFESLASGLEVSINRFNGLRELLARPGTAPLLKDHFLSMTVDQFGVERISNENNGFLDLGFVAALLLHQDIFVGFNDADRDDLLSNALRLQVGIRERYGRSASEEPAARVAANMFASGG